MRHVFCSVKGFCFCKSDYKLTWKHKLCEQFDAVTSFSFRFVFVFFSSSQRYTWLHSSSSHLIILLFFSHISSFDSFPRLDPPPPTGKKRLPRALKTTQDMMISSDPVVSSLEASDSHSFVPSPEAMPKEETRSDEEQRKGHREEATDNKPAENKVSADSESDGTSCELDGGSGGGEREEGVKGSTEGGVEENQFQLQLSVPDLINKDPPLDSKSKPCDVWQRASSPDSRLASTPRSGKTHCRISLGEEVLLGNGAPCSKDSGGGAEDAEPHPDLLSFE